jgi:hypothetical protein
LPTGGIRLPIFISGDFGTSPFWGQLFGKPRRLTVRGSYADFGPMSLESDVALGYVSGPDFDRLVRPAAMTRPR